MQNLTRVFDFADKVDIKIAEEAWHKMHRLTARIAEKHGFSSRVGAAVFSALSPNNDYHGNLRDCDRLLSAARQGLTIDQFKVSTYGNNKRKAWDITHGRDPLDLIVFPKTRNFYMNVNDPLDPHPVTVDGHIYNAWHGKRISLKGMAQKGNSKLYEEVAQDIRELGRIKGIIPNVVQGILWFSWRRMHKILYNSQLTLWDQEWAAAGFGLSVPSMQLKTPENPQRMPHRDHDSRMPKTTPHFLEHTLSSCPGGQGSSSEDTGLLPASRF